MLEYLLIYVHIQISLPKTVEAYLHRSGRTGRLGRKGKVITLIEDEQKFVIQRFSNELGIDIKERKLAIRSK
jgi:superfamily II DNA/RNA helicase